MKYLYEIHVEIKDNYSIKDIQHEIPNLLKDYVDPKLLMLDETLNYARYLAKSCSTYNDSVKLVQFEKESPIKTAWAMQLKITQHEYDSLKVIDIAEYNLDINWYTLKINKNVTEDYYKLAALKQSSHTQSVFRASDKTLLFSLEDFLEEENLFVSKDLAEPDTEVRMICHIQDYSESMHCIIRLMDKKKTIPKKSFKVKYTRKNCGERDDYIYSLSNVIYYLRSYLKYDPKETLRKDPQVYLHSQLGDKVEIIVFGCTKYELKLALKKLNLKVEISEESDCPTDDYSEHIPGVIVEDLMAPNYKAYKCNNEEQSDNQVSVNLVKSLDNNELHSIPSLFPELIQLDNVSNFNYRIDGVKMYISFSCSKDFITMGKVISLLNLTTNEYKLTQYAKSAVKSYDLTIKVPHGKVHLVYKGLRDRCVEKNRDYETSSAYVDKDNICIKEEYSRPDVNSFILKELESIYESLGLSGELVCEITNSVNNNDDKYYNHLHYKITSDGKIRRYSGAKEYHTYLGVDKLERINHNGKF